MFKLFHIDGAYYALCNSRARRNGFSHDARLMVYYGGVGEESGKKVSVHYCNRTSEEYPYKTVLYNLAERANIPEETKARFIVKIGMANFK